ncbi:integrase [Ignicoccus pacificus DSM 13166]|uniref:Integrase n=1 Tax=Ignicoccus pacificus DSM 13166 TaxID=940294 RepID=A0A977KA31_9CREN|nr:integrase [Ignicoccus pacificus DSM 13166]
MKNLAREIRRRLEELKILRRHKALAKRYGYLPYMIARYDLFVEDTLALLRAFERRPNDAIRCNHLRSPCKRLVERLEERGFKLKRVPWSSRCFEVTKAPFSLSSTPEHLDGWFYIMDKSSCLPPEVLSPSPGERVADLASAPGGKATYLAEMMGYDGELLAFERNRARVPALLNNIERMGSLNVKVIVDDAYNAPKYGPFDKALLDAPCTGEGVIARDPSRKRSKKIEDLVLMHKVQVALLNRALDSLKSGGILVYSTCSIAPEENELVLLAVLEGRDDVEVLDSGEAGSPGISEYLGFEFPEAVKCRRLWPHIHGSEGFFVCALRRI